MVHVQVVGSEWAARTASEARKALKNGADGVFLCAWVAPPVSEAWAGEETAAPAVAQATPAEVNACYDLIRSQFPTAFIGCNYLLDGPGAGLVVPVGADAIWTDYGAGLDDASAEHRRLTALQAELRSREWVGVHFGAFAFPKAGGDTEHIADAQLPVAGGRAAATLDVATTSGEATGVAMTFERARKVRAGIGAAAVLAIASGVTESNVVGFLSSMDIFLVATGLMRSLRQKQVRHYYPWTCPQCGLINELGSADYPTHCAACDHNRVGDDSYRAARERVAAAASADKLDSLCPIAIRRLADQVHHTALLAERTATDDR